MDIMRRKKATSTIKTSTTNNLKKKRIKNESTPTPPVVKITKYFVKNTTSASKLDVENKEGDLCTPPALKNLSVVANDEENIQKITKNQNQVKKEKLKTTFGSNIEGARTKIKERIKSFEKFNSPDECVLGSGMCATHNTKLIRIMKERKVSCVDKCGQISWVMKEVAALVCPKSGYSASKGGQNTTTTSQCRVG